MSAVIPKFLPLRILPTATWVTALPLTAMGPAAAPLSSASSAPTLAPRAPAYDLAPYMDILFDPSQELTIQQVSSPAFDLRFRRTSPRPTLKLGITASAVWLRFKLRRPHTSPAKGLPPRPGGRFIELDNTQIQFLDAYFPLAMAVGGRGQSISQVVQTGLSRPPDQRPILFRTFVIPVPDGYLYGRYIYLRLLSANTLTVRPYLYSQNGLQRCLAILGALTGYYRFASVLTHLPSLIEPCCAGPTRPCIKPNARAKTRPWPLRHPRRPRVFLRLAHDGRPAKVKGLARARAKRF